MNNQEKGVKLERRKFPRLKANLRVRYKVLQDKQANIDSQTKNISAGGICLFMDTQFEVGSLLGLEIEIPDYSYVPILAVGRLIWQARQTDSAGQARQTDSAGQARQTDSVGLARQTDSAGLAKKEDNAKTEYESGIEFVQIDEFDRYRISKYVESTLGSDS
jgi:c-di-GMP-binding flagellar brake protein YcgR